MEDFLLEGQNCVCAQRPLVNGESVYQVPKRKRWASAVTLAQDCKDGNDMCNLVPERDQTCCYVLVVILA